MTDRLWSLIANKRIAGKYSCIPCSRFGSVVVDRGISNRDIGQLLPHHLGRVSHRWANTSPRLEAILKFLFLGQLFLGYFSGPVEGIIMIVVIYMVTGYYGWYFQHSYSVKLVLNKPNNRFLYNIGPTFWNQKIWTVLHVEHLAIFSKIPNLPLNESFMVFAAVGLGMNIIHRYVLYF